MEQDVEGRYTSNYSNNNCISKKYIWATLCIMLSIIAIVFIICYYIYNYKGKLGYIVYIRNVLRALLDYIFFNEEPVSVEEVDLSTHRPYHITTDPRVAHSRINTTDPKHPSYENIHHFIDIIADYRDFNPSLYEEMVDILNHILDIHDRIVNDNIKPNCNNYINVTKDLKKKCVSIFDAFIYTLPLDKRLYEKHKDIMRYMVSMIDDIIKDMLVICPILVRIDNTYPAYDEKYYDISIKVFGKEKFVDRNVMLGLN